MKINRVSTDGCISVPKIFRLNIGGRIFKGGMRSQILKTLIIMKLILIFLLAGIFTVQAKSKAQSITYAAENTSLLRVFEVIEKQTDYVVFYNKDLLAKAEPLDINVQNMALDQFLELVFSKQPLEYFIEKKTIVIKERSHQSEMQLVEMEKQRQEVSGRVTDENGNPLEGVSVILKGSQIGTATNNAGYYQLNIENPENAILVFSMVGFQQVTVRLNGKNTINVTLKRKIDAQDEVVVIGYGTSRRSDLTGSISSVPDEVFDNPTFGDIGYAIQGQIAGVNILTGDGSPGEPVQISIRGINSLLGNTAPLIVLNDMPMPSEFNLNDLNPLNIESIDVLKGASSAAIYGSRAASGVVLIKTKQGEFNQKPVVNYSYNFGFDQMTSDIDVLSAAEWKYMVFEGVRNAAIYNGVAKLEDFRYYQNLLEPGFFGEYNTNWLDEMMQNSGFQNHSLSVRGGSLHTKYTASLGFTNDKGLMKESNFKRYNMSLGLNSKITDKLIFDVNLRGNFSERNRATATLADAIDGRPDLRAYNADGTPFVNIYYSSGEPRLIESPLSKLLDNINNNKSKTMGFSGYLQYNILENLSIRTRVNYNTYDSRFKLFYANTTRAGSGFGFAKAGSLTDSHRDVTQTEWENQLNYTLNFKEHKIDFLAATSYLAENRKYSSISFDDFPDNEIQNEFYQGATYRGSSGYNNEAFMMSYIGRINYKYKNRYLLTASFRRDGSSKFSADNAYGNFPSLAAAWIISNEPFLESQNWLNYIKLRAGIGKTGMADVGYYRWRTTYEATNYNGASAVIPDQAGNENLKWETSVQNDVGVDFRVLDSRIRGSVVYYVKNTEGLLYPFTLAPSTGFDNATVNFAKIRNSGFDIELQMDVLRKNNLSWTLGLNFNNNKNIVQKLDKDYITSTDGSQELNNSIIKEGYPLGLIYGFKTKGIYSNQKQIEADQALNPDKDYQRYMLLGEVRYVDLNGDGFVDLSRASAINNPDRTIIGYSLPDFSGGFFSTLNFKQWALNIFGSYSVGNDKVWVNELWNFGTSQVRPANVWRIALKRWTPENPDSKYPSFRLSRTFPSREFNDFSVYDASFLKIQHVQVGYDLPKELLSEIKIFSKVQAYAGVNNLYTFTSYPGPNPESYAAGDRIQGASMDYSQYPQNRTYNFGIKLTLK